MHCTYLCYIYMIGVNSWNIWISWLQYASGRSGVRIYVGQAGIQVRTGQACLCLCQANVHDSPQSVFLPMSSVWISERCQKSAADVGGGGGGIEPSIRCFLPLCVLQTCFLIQLLGHLFSGIVWVFSLSFSATFDFSFIFNSKFKPHSPQVCWRQRNYLGKAKGKCH